LNLVLLQTNSHTFTTFNASSIYVNRWHFKSQDFLLLDPGPVICPLKSSVECLSLRYGTILCIGITADVLFVHLVYLADSHH
jgi:hypothetical protein